MYSAPSGEKEKVLAGGFSTWAGAVPFTKVTPGRRLAYSSSASCSGAEVGPITIRTPICSTRRRAAATADVPVPSVHASASTTGFPAIRAPVTPSAGFGPARLPPWSSSGSSAPARDWSYQAADGPAQSAITPMPITPRGTAGGGLVVVTQTPPAPTAIEVGLPVIGTRATTRFVRRSIFETTRAVELATQSAPSPTAMPATPLGTATLTPRVSPLGGPGAFSGSILQTASSSDDETQTDPSPAAIPLGANGSLTVSMKRSPDPGLLLQTDRPKVSPATQTDRSTARPLNVWYAVRSDVSSRGMSIGFTGAVPFTARSTWPMIPSA